MYAAAETCARRVPPATSRRAAANHRTRTALPGVAPATAVTLTATASTSGTPARAVGRRRATQPWPRCAGVVWQSAWSCYFHALGKRKGSASAVATRPLRSWVVLTSCAHASICTLSGSPCILSAAPSRPSSRATAGLVDIDAKPGREARDTVEHLGELSI
jgi:hypothetical protein